MPTRCIPCSVVTLLANPVDVKALSDQREPCFRGNSRHHLSSHGVVYVSDVSASPANQVRVRWHIGIVSCLAIWKSQFSNKAQLVEYVKGLVDSRETDGGVHGFDFSVDALSAGMISTAKSEPADRDPLRGSFVSFLAESVDYLSIRGPGVHFHIDY